MIKHFVNVPNFSSRTRATFVYRSRVRVNFRQFSSQDAFENYSEDIKEAFSIKSKAVLHDYGQSEATLYVHKGTGAEVLSVLSSDENKVFGVTFPTPPSSSDGVAHILEHSVFCGSRKYPCKEPFVELMKGSMYTFLNAMTYADRTCYPVASTNLKDFYNLVDVYLDAVFFPKLTRETFAQEGWHYKLEQEDGMARTGLSYQGIVLNEMKGVYSQPESLLGRYEQQALFPSNQYRFDSGGDPTVIPELTYQHFMQFHRTHYQPKHAKLFFYGDDPEEERLKRISSLLSRQNIQEMMGDATPGLVSAVEYQEKSNRPFAKVRIPYSSSPTTEEDSSADDGDHFVTVNWLLNDSPMSTEERLCLNFLSALLLGSSSSPLYKDLISSGLGSSVIGYGLNDELLQSTFSVGLKGVTEANVRRIESCVFESLQNICEEGFGDDAITSVMNTVEFSLREFNAGGIPRGLGLMLGINPGWLYDGNPFQHIDFSSHLKRIRKRVASKEKVFEDLIEKYLLKNMHRANVELYPDSSLGEQIEQDEQGSLEATYKSMSEDDLSKVAETYEALDLHRSSPDDEDAVNTIPSLKRKDMRRDILTVPREVVNHTVENLSHTLLLHEQPDTNEIVYVDVMLPIRNISAQQIHELPLLCRGLVETGTADLDGSSFIEHIGMYTGGISASLSVIPEKQSSVEFEDKFDVRLVLSGKATEGNVIRLIEYLEKALLESDLKATTRIQEILKEKIKSMESTIMDSGHSIAAMKLRSKLKRSSWFVDQYQGLAYYDALRQLGGSLDRNKEGTMASLCDDLSRLRQQIVNQDSITVNITGSAAGISLAEEQVRGLLNRIGQNRTRKDGHIVIPSEDLMPVSGANELLIIPSQVNYVVQGALLLDSDLGQANGSWQVATRYLQNSWLWNQVRVIGGAYGSYCSLNDRSGVFTFASYRDPGMQNTIDVYDRSANFLDDLTLSCPELDKAIVGTISEMDAPEPASAKGYKDTLRYLSGFTDADRQKFRDEVLATQESDFKDLAQAMRNFSKNKINVVVGGENIEDTQDIQWEVRSVFH